MPTGHPRKYNLQTLNATHRRILARLVWGLWPRDIMRELGVGRGTVSNARNSPVGRDELSAMDEEISEVVMSTPLWALGRVERQTAYRALRTAHIAFYDHGGRIGQFLTALRNNEASGGPERGSRQEGPATPISCHVQCTGLCGGKAKGH